MQQRPGKGYTTLKNILAQLPNDNRMRYKNLGKGVMFRETDAQAERFVNEFQHVVSCKVFRKRFPGMKRYADLTSAALSSTGRPASSGPNQLSWSISLLRQVTYPSPRGGLRCEWL